MKNFFSLAALLCLLSLCSFGQSNQNNFNGSSGNGVTITTVGGLASVPGKTKGTIAVVTDGTSATDCTVGLGSTVVVCQYSGTSWAQVVAASSGATAFSALTGSTNSSAAMVIGSGASLNPGGTGVNNANQVNGATIPLTKTIVGTDGSGHIIDASSATLANNTTGSAASLSISGQTALLTFTGPTVTNRNKIVRDAADTILELGGTYTPTGTWNWTSCSGCTWPTFNQNTTGTAANLSGTPALPNGTTATTQTVGDNTTKLATDAFVMANAGGGGLSGQTVGGFPIAATSTTSTSSTTPGTNQGTYYVGRQNSTQGTAATGGEIQVGDCASPTTVTGAGTTGTILFSDVVGCVVRHDIAGSAGATITIPTPTTLNNAHPLFVYENDSTHADTLSPTTFTISLSNATAAATLSVPSQVSCKVQLDPVNASTWKADCHPITTSSGSMVYPGAGIPNSTGTAWGTSYSANGTDTKVQTGTGSFSATNMACGDANGGVTPCTALPSGMTLNGGGTITQTICSGTISLGTTLIASGAKSTVTQATCTGLATTDNIQMDFNADPSGVTGYAPSASGTLTLIKFPTANTINVYQYNDTGSSITPGAMTVNYRVVR